VTLYAQFDAYEFNRYDFGETITFRLYKKSGDTFAKFNANAYDSAVIKTFKRHGDRAFFFRDVAKALTVIGQVAQIIGDLTATLTDKANGVGTFAWTNNLRPSVPGYHWMMVQLQKNAGGQESSKLVRVFIHPSEAE